jgi:hypothetical protein
MKHLVNITINMNMEVSEDYLQKLQKNLHIEVLKHCFKNHNRHLINESIEVINIEGSKV